MTRLERSLTAAVLAAALTGCGGGSGSGDDYCSTVKDQRAELKALGSGDAPTTKQFAAATDAVNAITDAAPAGIKDEWKTVGTGFEDVQNTLDEIGLEVDELDDSSKVASLSADKQKKLQSVAEDVKGVGDATKKVTADVKKRCKIDLSS